MKPKIFKARIQVAFVAYLMICMAIPTGTLLAQDTIDAPVKAKIKPVKNTFQSIWIIENQTVMVPIKGTFEMDIQHRFGTVAKGYEDFWGFFAPSNIRLGVSYAPIDKLNLGIGLTKSTASTIPNQAPSTISGPLWDVSAKYSIITQTKGLYPVSVTYYGNAAYNTKKDINHDIYRNEKVIGIQTDRFNYYHQLIIARKINDKLSVQVSPSISHQNVVNGYFVQLDSVTLKAKPEMKFDHFAVSFAARYKLTDVTSLIMNYDQPISKHISHNPNPNLSLGFEFSTSSHAFQLFLTNYYYMIPQVNNLYNRSDPFNHVHKSTYNTVNLHFLDNFRIGFNITRLWNY